MGLLTMQHLDAEVCFYGLWMQDAAVSFDDEPAQDAPFGSVSGARLVMHSAGHTHTAGLRAEVWGDVPPQLPGPWEQQAEARVDVPSGRLQLWTYTAMTMDEIALGVTCGTWRVRVYVTGRGRVRELAQHDVPEGVEQYVVQFWPA
ncbi:hypothetical protein AB0B06_36470 [Streptomyces sp. NPDC044989]|uniref:hypothetical protein n=1 Tax=Streptomyces sp. NPDC044989 TaxID=3154336 RepID=UPI0033C1C637